MASCSPQPKVHTQLRQPALATAYNRLIFAGDVMFARDVRRQILAAQDYALPFRKVAPLMAGSDIAFVNLESPFSDRGPYFDGGLIFHAEPKTISGMQLAKIAVVSTANNHARDCGPHGVEFTVSWLRSHGMAAVGSGLNADQAHMGAVLARHGVRFGFLGYTYDQSNGNWKDIDSRVAIADVDVMKSDVATLRKRADVVIVSMHHGIEYVPQPSKAQVEFAHAAIDAGATLVVGHHPHVMEPTEQYHGGEIIYSLGNFVFDQYQRTATQHGEIVQVSFVGRRILATHTMPVLITKSGPELEESVTGGPLDVAAKLEAHGGQHLLGKGILLPRTEAGKER
jgi:poly-gamma-glutamate capsule biosynthesis protein CapA/YwtB (metallophosphatase superfamily)